VGDVHLGESFLLAGAGGVVHLGYLTPMERDEAAASGLPLLTPEALEVTELSAETDSEDELWYRLLERAFDAAGIAPCRAALAGQFPAGTVHAVSTRLEGNGWRFEPGHELLRSLRKSKTADEIEAIRQAADATCEAMRRVATLLAAAKPGDGGLVLGSRPVTAALLRREVSLAFGTAGLEQPKGNIVAGGPDAGIPHSQGASERQLQAGESIVVDLYPRNRLFADCTRTFCVGEASGELTKAHTLVLEALRQAQAAARPGASGWELQRRTCELFEGAGYPTPLDDPGTTRGYVHGLGHGVGLELHELPSFRKRRGASGTLSEGDVFTLEPGLYDPEAGWGVRLEDLCLLAGGELEILTRLPYDLDPRAWTLRR
jgi:Xaa-Pro aminopeptidase